MMEAIAISTPEILDVLNDKNQISSKRVAELVGKQHKHVIRDASVLAKELRQNEDHPDLRDLNCGAKDGPDLDHLNFVADEDRPTYIREIWMDLAFASQLLSGYKGPKANLAKRLVREALLFFLEKAPALTAELERLRDENIELRARAERRALKAGSEPSKVLVRIKIKDLLPGFEPYYVFKYVTPQEAALLSQEKDLADLSHLRKTRDGINRKYERVESQILGIH